MKLKNLIAVLFLASAFFLSACSKKNEDQPSGNYIKLKINGSWVTWTNVFAEISPVTSGSEESSFALTSNEASMNKTLGMLISTESPTFTTGTYNSEEEFLRIMYTTRNSPTDITFYGIGYTDSKGSSDYTITITSITDETVSGRFTGNFLIEDFNDDFVELTEGEFVARRIR